MPLVSWRHVRVHRDDFRVVTGESDGELMMDDFWGVTGESDVELMLSCNQLKVGESSQGRQPRRNRCRSSDFEREKEFFLRGQG